MSDTPHTSGGGIISTAILAGSWLFTYIASFQMVPLIMSCIVSAMGIINYVIIWREKIKNKK